MKKKNELTPSQIENQKIFLKRQRLRSLIIAALQRYSEDDIVEAFNKEAENTYAIEKDKDDVIYDLVLEGYVIFKPEYSTQADQLKEYAENFVFPYYNQQQDAILF